MNPFSLVYSALWDLVLQHPYFQVVAPGNVIRFDSKENRNPLKTTVAASDLPEIMLLIDSTTGNLLNTSSTSTCTRTYSWQLASGDYRYSELMGKLEWALFCAMVDWPNKLAGLRWKEKPFVTRVNLPSAVTGVSNAELNRNINGWAALWRAEVEMHFATEDMLKEIRCDNAST